MAWNETRARARIREDLKALPTVAVEDLRSMASDAQSGRMLSERATISKKVVASVVNIPRSKAILADTVQVYVDILNFDDVRGSRGTESEDDHRAALSFLHLCYAAVDRVIDGSDLQRVDFHDTRVHLVVLADKGTDVGAADIAIALRLAAEIQSVIRSVATQSYGESFVPSVRCGVDVGPCIAINNGTALEPEPLFIGPAANNAAKLAAGDEGGVFLSATVQKLVALESTRARAPVMFSDFTDPNIARYMETAFDRMEFEEGEPPANSGRMFELITERVENAIDRARAFIREQNTSDTTRPPEFSFFFKAPPLANIDFKELMPSHTIRQDILTIFADICGYTQFVEDCLAVGHPEIAVRALYIIRNELRAVLEEDFEGRKLRFIGDCIAGLSSSGKGESIDLRASVAHGVLIASAMLSSLEICKQELEDIPQLQLSVGLEIGATPVSRIGIRGERSIRVASSQSTSDAEKIQRACDPGQVKLGATARAHLPDGAHDFIDEISGLGDLREYSFVDSALGARLDDFQPSAPSILTSRAHADPSSSFSPARAHLNSK